MTLECDAFRVEYNIRGLQEYIEHLNQLWNV